MQLHSTNTLVLGAQEGLGGRGAAGAGVLYQVAGIQAGRAIMLWDIVLLLWLPLSCALAAAASRL